MRLFAEAMCAVHTLSKDTIHRRSGSIPTGDAYVTMFMLVDPSSFTVARLNTGTLSFCGGVVRRSVIACDSKKGVDLTHDERANLKRVSTS